MVFVDNRAENAAGAEAIGAVGHHHTSPESLRAFLEGLRDSPASVDRGVTA
jgi:putative hydrolase of the HAD superfamily